ncbi:Predicted arabinose efflux permease, MFS family [Microbacterium sp. cf046]|nr:Predicted arabinose efflux permease, MFS family [Microbacterium sp. cf046]
MADGSRAPRRLARTGAFAVATAALTAIFVSSGMPIPLYNLYRLDDGITNSALAVTTVGYLCATAVALLAFGRLSNHLGRRPVAVVSIVLAIAGVIVLSQVHSLPILLLGRVLQGFACGIASSTLGAYVVDTAPAKPRAIGALVTASAPPFGISMGAILSGFLVESGPAPRTLAFHLIAGVLIVLALLLALCPETMQRTPGALRSLRPRIQTPRGSRRILIGAAAAFIATWAIAGFYQAFAPSMTADYLDTNNGLTVALVFSSVVILNPVGGIVAGWVGSRWSLRVGLIAFALAFCVVVAAMTVGDIRIFLLASLIASIGMGAASTSAIDILMDGAEPLERAGLLATVYLISYGGAATTGLFSTATVDTLGLSTLATIFAALCTFLSIVAIAALRVTKPG